MSCASIFLHSYHSPKKFKRIDKWTIHARPLVRALRMEHKKVRWSRCTKLSRLYGLSLKLLRSTQRHPPCTSQLWLRGGPAVLSSAHVLVACSELQKCPIMASIWVCKSYQYSFHALFFMALADDAVPYVHNRSFKTAESDVICLPRGRWRNIITRRSSFSTS